MWKGGRQLDNEEKTLCLHPCKELLVWRNSLQGWRRYGRKIKIYKVQRVGEGGEEGGWGGGVGWWEEGGREREEGWAEEETGHEEG